MSNRIKVEGAYQKIAYTMFNPSSRQHCLRWLSDFGYKPENYTTKGTPKIDEETLKTIDSPEAKLLMEYFKLNKEYGMLYNGENSIMKHTDTLRGVLKHHCISLGANTGRMTHSSINLSQTPSTKEFRELFIAPFGYKIVGADMDAQELRVLAHYLYPYDGGKYLEAVLNGKKEDKTDIHSINQQIAELETRDEAKTLIYAILYGASEIKIGYGLTKQGFALSDITNKEYAYVKKKIHNRIVEKEGKKFFPIHKESLIPVSDELIHRGVKGVRVYQLFMDRTTGYKQMKADIEAAFESRGFLYGLDGRRLHCRSKHSIINLLCQSAAAEVTKTWLCETHRLIRKVKLRFGDDYRPLAVIHDEQQLAAKDGKEHIVGSCLVEAASNCDKILPLKAPMSASYKVGNSWADTH